MAERRREGFTLIELLVVIAIIAILAAILFPVLSRSKQKGYESACLANLRQIGGALSLYLQDSSDRFPPYSAHKGHKTPRVGYIDPGTTTPSIAGMVGILQPYVKNNDMWMCPVGARRAWGAGKCTVPVGGSAAMVGWVRLPSGTSISTNYVSYALNKDHDYPDCKNIPPYPQSWSEVNCALGKTPNECQARWGRLFHPGQPMHNPNYSTRWSGRLIQDGYTVNLMEANRVWQPHRQCNIILYFDLHAEVVLDPRAGKTN